MKILLIQKMKQYMNKETLQSFLLFLGLYVFIYYQAIPEEISTKVFDEFEKQNQEIKKDMVELHKSILHKRDQIKQLNQVLETLNGKKDKVSLLHIQDMICALKIGHYSMRLI